MAARGIALALTLLLFAPTARAGGILVPGAGPQGQARAGAFVAKSDDPSAMSNNPAGFARVRGTVVGIGVNLVDYDESFLRSGSYEASGEAEALNYEGQPYPEISDQSRPSIGLAGFQAIPLLVVASDLGRPHWPLRFAFGVFAPQGFPERNFAERVDAGTSDLAPGPQRYDNMQQQARIAMPAIAVAYSPMPNLDLGVRLGWGYATIHGRKAVWSITNYEEWEGRDSIFTIDVKDKFVPGAAVGALWRPARQLEVGASWQSPMYVRAKGTGNSRLGGNVGGGFEIETQPVPDEFTLCARGGTAEAFKSCLTLDIPQIATLGGRWIFRDPTGAERGDVEVDVAWENWSKASNTSIIVDAEIVIDNGTATLPLNTSLSRHGFQDVWSVRVGGSWAVKVAGRRLELRAGAAHDTKTAPVSWTRVDLDGKPRTTIAAGLGLVAGRYRIDLGGGVVLEPDRTVGQCKPPGGPTLADRGCGTTGEDTPFNERVAPDPGQPRQGQLNQFESPFNAGFYKSGYILLHLGFTVAL